MVLPQSPQQLNQLCQNHVYSNHVFTSPGFLVQNSDSEFSDRRLNFRVSLWVSPEATKSKRKRVHDGFRGVDFWRAGPP